MSYDTFEEDGTVPLCPTRGRPISSPVCACHNLIVLSEYPGDLPANRRLLMYLCLDHIIQSTCFRVPINANKICKVIKRVRVP